ncbi:MAG: cation-translocating P-type ATPase [Gammaproteobacteria bacterium]|nr:cation-translocating P-type ATPase [Gammaproteobacteria bacterium]
MGRSKHDVYNELPGAKPRSVWAIAWEVVREPMFMLLMGCGLLYLLVGEPKEAAVLLGFVLVVMGITLYQERKTERALEALRDLSSPRALVIRGGERVRIPGREVVRGDWVVLVEGDRVPADALLLDASHLVVDESLLTGESVPVRKAAGTETAEMARPGGEDTPCVFSGTLVVSGQGVAQVEAVGLHTEIGKIGRALQTIESGHSPMQEETGRLVRRVAIGAGLLCTAVVLIHGLSRGPWVDSLLTGIALAMALLPEEFPVVLTIFLALGAWRISKRQVLTRRISAVETLGSATTLCVDKTGTLTENRMRVRTLVTTDGELVEVGNSPLPEWTHQLVECAILATRSDPFDPMERAIHSLGLNDLVDEGHLHRDWRMVREYPLAPGLLSMTQVWEHGETGKPVIAAKGAPEAIADLCHLAGPARERLLEQVGILSERGLRVLGVAAAEVTHQARRQDLSTLPEQQHDFAFTLLGLVGLVDPVRQKVPEAVTDCRRAGIHILMITGDYAGTARSIAREIGLPNPEYCLTGPELDSLSDEALAVRLHGVSIIARAVPEQKLRIVRALQADGEVVAMTGDGVNDAPALRAADIGVAMGGRGTDVAREAGDLVVVDDDFSSIVQAVRLGRRIFDNLKRAMGYIVAVHIPIAGMSILPVLMGWPLLLLPAHIAFLELIIDPACSVAFEAEAEDAGTMQRPPRDRSEPLFGARGLLLSLAQGLLVWLAVVAVYLTGVAAGEGESETRALAFITLVLGNLALIIANRSRFSGVLATLRDPNPALWSVVLGALGFLTLVVALPGLRDLFYFKLPTVEILGISVLVGLLLPFVVGHLSQALQSHWAVSG